MVWSWLLNQESSAPEEEEGMGSNKLLNAKNKLENRAEEERLRINSANDCSVEPYHILTLTIV